MKITLIVQDLTDGAVRFDVIRERAGGEDPEEMTMADALVELMLAHAQELSDYRADIM